MAVEGGGYTLYTLENSNEIVRILKAHLAGNVGNAFVGSPEQLLGLFNLPPVDVVYKGLPSLLAEAAGEIAGAQVTEVGHFFHGNVVPGVVMNIHNGGINGAAGLHRELFL